MLLVFCSFHITHNIQKPISSLLQDGANYSARDTFFEGITDHGNLGHITLYSKKVSYWVHHDSKLGD